MQFIMLMESLNYIDADIINQFTTKQPDENGEYYTKSLSQISNDELDNYEYDIDVSRMMYDDMIEYFSSHYCTKFKSFCDSTRQGKYKGHPKIQGIIICENDLFYITCVDDDTQFAFSLIEKESLYEVSDLRKKHFQEYLDGIRETLVYLCGECYGYDGLWTRGKKFSAENISQ